METLNLSFTIVGKLFLSEERTSSTFLLPELLCIDSERLSPSLFTVWSKLPAVLSAIGFMVLARVSIEDLSTNLTEIRLKVVINTTATTTTAIVSFDFRDLRNLLPLNEK